MEGNVSKIHGQEFPRLILPLCSPCGERRGSLPPPPCMGSFNPRSPCGERPESEIRQVTPCSVSIHAPRVGSDIILCCNAKVARKFQSTLPVWGATPSLPNYATEHMFQSTLPVWGATARFGPDVNTAYVSIHAPRVGSDCKTAQNSFSNFRGICRLCQKASCGTKYKRQSSVHSVRILAKFMREATGNLLGVSPSHLQNG